MKRTKRRFTAIQNQPLFEKVAMAFVFDASTFKQARRKFQGICRHLSHELNGCIYLRSLTSSSNKVRTVNLDQEGAFAIYALGKCPVCGYEAVRREAQPCIVTCLQEKCRIKYLVRTDADNCNSCKHKLDCIVLPNDLNYKVTKTKK